MRCGIYNTLPLHLAPHHILHCIISSTSNAISDIILSHTTFHITPSFLTILHISYHSSNSQHTAIPLHNTVFKSHHIGHIMYHTTSRIAPHFTLLTYHIPCTPCHIQITPYTGHIICASHHHITHHILHNIALHSTCSTSCIIPPHL